MEKSSNKYKSYVDLYHEVNNLTYSLKSIDNNSELFYEDKSKILIDFVKSSFIKADYFQDTFPFVCTSFCHIKDHQTWDTFPQKDYLFYHNHLNKAEDIEKLAVLLYLYGAIADHLNTGQRTSSLLSSTISKPCSIRVQMAKSIEDKWRIESDNEKSILTIIYPSFVFPKEWKHSAINLSDFCKGDIAKKVIDSYKKGSTENSQPKQTEDDFLVKRESEVAEYFRKYRNIHLEKLTGFSHDEICKSIEDALFSEDGCKFTKEYFDEKVFKSTGDKSANLKKAIAVSILGVCYCSFAMDTTVEYICRTPFELLLDGKPKKRGLGSLILGYPNDYDLSPQAIENLNIKRKEAIIIYDLINSYLANCYTQHLLSEIKIAQVKSSIAAIMGRNGSHNLGSHVISNLTSYFSNPTDMQYFNKYMQHRMDFMASITSDWPRWTSSMSLCKFIMRYFFQQRLILNHIIRAEGLTAFEIINKEVKAEPKNKLIIKVGKLLENNKINWIIDPTCSDPDHSSLTLEDVNLAIPGGIVGLHAFYSIIENTLRNIAKYDWIKRPQGCINLEYYILFKENQKNVDLYITSNVCLLNQENNPGFVNLMNSKLLSPIVDPITNSHRTNNLGLAEIKICSEFINRSIPSNVDNSLGHLSSKIRIEPLPLPEININQWCYQFVIPKPKIALFIGTGFCDEDYNGSMIDIIYNETENTDFDYDFIIYESETNQTALRTPKPNQPLRVLEFSKEDVNSIRERLTSKGIIQENEEKCHTYIFIKYLPLIYKDENLLIDLNITLRDPNYSNQVKIQDHFSNFYNEELEKINDTNKDYTKNSDDIKRVVASLYHKYEEHIETLPKIFTDRSKNGTSHNTDNVKQEISHYEINFGKRPSSRKEIHFKRHANNLFKNYYTESISGSQSYFYELENLYTEINKSKDYTQLSYSSQIFLFEIIEGARYHFHIFDERMFVFFSSLKNTTNLYKFYNTGIKACQSINNTLSDANKFKNCNCGSYGQYYCSLYMDSKDDHQRIAIIHIGILDKIKENIPELLTRMLDSYSYIILTSGRAPSFDHLREEYLGESPGELWNKCRFMAVSEVHHALKKQFPEKALLSGLIMKSQIKL